MRFGRRILVLMKWVGFLGPRIALFGLLIDALHFLSADLSVPFAARNGFYGVNGHWRGRSTGGHERSSSEIQG